MVERAGTVDRLADIIASHVDMFYVSGAPPARAISAARAVIEALMDPTPEMLDAMCEHVDPLTGNSPTAAWQAALRTALSQPNDEGEGK